MDGLPGYVQNGQHTVSIRERARRIYTPSKSTLWRLDPRNKPKAPLSLKFPNGDSLEDTWPASTDIGTGSGSLRNKKGSLRAKQDSLQEQSVISHVSGLTMEGVGGVESVDIAEAYDHREIHSNNNNKNLKHMLKKSPGGPRRVPEIAQSTEMLFS